jgi:hypothetical protein
MGCVSSVWSLSTTSIRPGAIAGIRSVNSYANEHILLTGSWVIRHICVVEQLVIGWKSGYSIHGELYMNQKGKRE